MKVIGLMSGTSADGIDLALCDITGHPPQLDAKIVDARTYPYDLDLRQRILENCDPQSSDTQSICNLNFDLARTFAHYICTFLEEIQINNVGLIGSHGHTIWHEVNSSGDVRATLQIGEAGILAEETGITTVSNFRSRDVAVGGQGAPLTGYVDWLLLRHPNHWRAIQNIGGMGNVTFLPPLSNNDSEPIAFDTGPGNALIDIVVAELTEGEYIYDAGGEMASGGTIDELWLEQLLEHPYFSQHPPKTTGREVFGTEMAKELVQEGISRNLNPPDIIATVTSLTAQSIADAYTAFAPAPIHEVIIGGGGKHNLYLLQFLEALLGIPVRTHEDIGMSSDFKEALVFAVLAYETWYARAGNHPTVTGAKTSAILGDITPGDNYRALIQETWGIK